MSNDLRLEGVALYNPRLLSKDELTRDFVVRTELLEQFLDDLRRGQPDGQMAHHLLLAQRGMGKTTFLQRLRYAIEDDPELDQHWLPVSFPEEQYNIAGLADLWLNCLDAIADTLEARGAPSAHLDQVVEDLETVPKSQRAEQAFAALRHEAERQGRTPILLIDNVDLVFERLSAHHSALRRLLSQGGIVLIGASSRALEWTYDYGAPFYEFFAVQELGGLKEPEVLRLMGHLAARTGADDVARLVREQPGRIEPIRILSGGNPRTIVMLFTILSQGVEGDVRSDLDRLLDLCTPLYKHRFEELTSAQQRVVHALCVHWHPIGSKGLAESLEEKSTTVSGQLERLFKIGVVEKVPLADDTGLLKKTGYQVAERFFNIWYLMRTSRRVRRRLVWLVEFLRITHTAEERRARAQGYLGGIQDPEVGLAYAMSLAEEDGALRAAVEHRSLQQILASTTWQADLGEMLDLDGDDRDLRPRVERLRDLKRARELLESRGLGHHWAPIGGSYGSTAAECVRACSLERTALEELASKLAQAHAMREAILGVPLAHEFCTAVADGWDLHLNGLGQDLEAYVIHTGGTRLGHALLAANGSSEALAALVKGGDPEPATLLALFHAMVQSNPSQIVTSADAVLTRCPALLDAYLVMTQSAAQVSPDASVLLLLALAKHQHLMGEEQRREAMTLWDTAASGPGLGDAAAVLVFLSSWPSAARFASRVAGWLVDQLRTDGPHVDTGPAIAQRATQLGHALDLAHRIDAAGLTDQHLPLRTALVAAHHRDPNILLSVAPEVRQAARPLYDLFIQEPDPT